MEYFHPMWFIRLAAGPPNFGLPRLLLTKLFCGVASKNSSDGLGSWVEDGRGAGGLMH